MTRRPAESIIRVVKIELDKDPTDWAQLIKDLDARWGYDSGKISDQEALTISNVSAPFTVQTSGTTPNVTLSDLSWDLNKSWGRGLQVDGDVRISPSHDVLIGDVSLKNTLSEIQARLNILQPNPNLEREWDELRELGERYRALEQEILDKQQVWNALKKRSGPEIT